MHTEKRTTRHYLAAVPADKRAALERVRKEILAAAPGEPGSVATVAP